MNETSDDDEDLDVSLQKIKEACASSSEALAKAFAKTAEADKLISQQLSLLRGTMGEPPVPVYESEEEEDLLERFGRLRMMMNNFKREVSATDEKVSANKCLARERRGASVISLSPVTMFLFFAISSWLQNKDCNSNPAATQRPCSKTKNFAHFLTFKNLRKILCKGFVYLCISNSKPIFA